MQFPNLKKAFARNVVVIVALLRTTASAPRQPRLSIADWGDGYHEQGHQGEGTYAFGYDIDDPATGNTQYRNEERHPNGSVTGSYGLVEPDGNVRVVHYIADANGFRVNIVNSEKPNAVFPAPTPALVPSNPPESIPETPEKPLDILEKPEQPEINFEVPMEVSEGPSEQPELSFETPELSFETPARPSEEAVESAEGNQEVPSPPNTIVLPGGIVIEIPPDDPEDNSLDEYHHYNYNEVLPTYVTSDTPSLPKYQPQTYSPMQSFQVHPYSIGHNGYYANKPYYGYPSYSPYFAFMSPYGYYSDNK